MLTSEGLGAASGKQRFSISPRDVYVCNWAEQHARVQGELTPKMEEVVTRMFREGDTIGHKWDPASCAEALQSDPDLRRDWASRFAASEKNVQRVFQRLTREKKKGIKERAAAGAASSSSAAGALSSSSAAASSSSGSAAPEAASSSSAAAAVVDSSESDEAESDTEVEDDVAVVAAPLSARVTRMYWAPVESSGEVR